MPSDSPVNRLIAMADTLSLPPSSLDESVRAAKEDEAEFINGEGYEAQVDYLVGEWGEKRVENLIRRMSRVAKL